MEPTDYNSVFAHYRFPQKIEQMINDKKVETGDLNCENDIKISFKTKKMSFHFWLHLYFMEKNP